MDYALWTEKYRPQTFDQVRGQPNVIKRLRAFVKTKNMPHLLFAGPAGVGKSTLALVIAKELFGSNWKESFLELNASDERGIDVVRIKVKDFARTKSLADAPFKIIFLDECDALTKEAQQALRRTMENYTRTCRFVLSCNYFSKIIDPIQSRCAVFKFKPLAKEDIISLVDDIAKKENIVIDADAKDALYEISEGDCRKVENFLQSTAAISKNITKKSLYSVSSQAFPDEIKEILSLEFLESRKKLLDLMLNKGLSGIDIIKQIQKNIWGLDYDDSVKLKMIQLCGDIEFRMVEGSDEYLQLETLLAAFNLIKKR